MAYGIEIRNGRQKVVLDDSYSNYYLTTDTPYTALPGASWPPPGVNQYTDFVLAAPAVSSDGYVGIYRDDDPANDVWNDYLTDHPSSYRYYIARKYTDGGFTSGLTYGVEAKNDSGDLLFTPPDVKSFDVINYAEWPGANADLVFPGTAGTYSDFQDYFILINFTVSVRSGSYLGAKYVWTSSTTGRIELKTVNGVFVRPQRVVIAKIRG
jgi:hypothetical protein